MSTWCSCLGCCSRCAGPTHRLSRERAPRLPCARTHVRAVARASFGAMVCVHARMHTHPCTRVRTHACVHAHALMHSRARTDAAQPLREGNANAPKEYSLTSFSFPIGIGIRFNITENTSIALEWMNRTTSTDYLDDVSGRYIDNAEFDNFFGAGTVLADQAKQKANFPSWLNGVHVNGFLPTEPRGSLKKFNDYYYTTSIKLFISLGRIIGNNESWIGGVNYLKCPPSRF